MLQMGKDRSNILPGSYPTKQWKRVLNLKKDLFRHVLLSENSAYYISWKHYNNINKPDPLASLVLQYHTWL